MQRTLISLNETLHRWSYEILIDSEVHKTGLQNTPKRFQDLYEKSKGDYIVKSDDDMFYFDGWYEECLKNLCLDSSIGYISPLNHIMIKNHNGRSDMSIGAPIQGKGGCTYQPFISGGCWVFHRNLWQKIPYGNLNGIKTLDSNYGAAVRKAGLHPAYLNQVLASHMGVDRHGGVDA